MVNILGTPDSKRGPTLVDGLEAVLSEEGASVHLYGKAEARPNRKMGHVTVTAQTRDEAVRRAERIQQALRVFGGTYVDG
jgi:5-(carboxyamino)imidazole ribonucleotide synthase